MSSPLFQAACVCVILSITQPAHISELLSISTPVEPEKYYTKCCVICVSHICPCRFQIFIRIFAIFGLNGLARARFAHFWCDIFATHMSEHQIENSIMKPHPCSTSYRPYGTYWSVNSTQLVQFINFDKTLRAASVVKANIRTSRPTLQIYSIYVGVEWKIYGHLA